MINIRIISYGTLIPVKFCFFIETSSYNVPNISQSFRSDPVGGLHPVRLRILYLNVGHLR
jgi:hypothetical protein